MKNAFHLKRETELKSWQTNFSTLFDQKTNRFHRTAGLEIQIFQFKPDPEPRSTIVFYSFFLFLGEKPGLMVKADGSRGRGFEPQHRMLDRCK